MEYKLGWHGKSKYARGEENCSIQCFHPSRKNKNAWLHWVALNQLVYVREEKGQNTFVCCFLCPWNDLILGEGMKIVHYIIEMMTFFLQVSSRNIMKIQLEYVHHVLPVNKNIWILLRITLKTLKSLEHIWKIKCQVGS